MVKVVELAHVCLSHLSDGSGSYLQFHFRVKSAGAGADRLHPV